MSDTTETSDADDDTVDVASGASEEEKEENDLDKHEFKNWIRGMKSLEYLQQGLAPFVDRAFAIEHSNFMQRLNVNFNALPQAHCKCTSKNILPDHAGGPCYRQNHRLCYCFKPSKNRRKCINGICSKLIDFIVQEHYYTDPSLKYSVISEWSTNAWSIAKCYTSDTKCEMDSARSTDASGLLNIILNANFIHQRLACNIDPPNDIISQAREYRNELHHKASQELTDQELQVYLDHFIQVLEDPTTLLNDPDAKSAVAKLKKLKVDQIDITKEEMKTIKRTVSKVKLKTENIETSMNELANRVKQTEDDIEKLKENVSGRQGVLTTSNSNVDEDQSEEDEQEDVIPDIPTDDDVRQDIEDEPIDLREYQKELAQKGIEGKNVIVVAPTNTGKTRVACKIIQDHFRSKAEAMSDVARVAFIVTTEPLAFQQGEQCAKLLPHYRTKVITGRVQRQKKHYLKDYIQRRDILVVTAQLLLNALNLKNINSLKEEFSLIVIDECHHTTGYHIYHQLMCAYLDMKMRDNIGLPQIVGLTASLGVGGSTFEGSVKTHMKNILASLDTHYLSTVKETNDQLQEFANKAKEYKKVSPRRSNDSYRIAVIDIINYIDMYMANHDSLRRLPVEDEFIKEKCNAPSDKGSEKFAQWIGILYDSIGKLQNDQAVQMLSPCCHHLEAYNKALMMHADARICDSLAVLETFMERQNQTNETDEMLARLYRSLKEKNFDGEPENPKLQKLEMILLKHIKGEESRCIIFTKTIDLATKITKWINDSENLRKLNARELLGRKSMSRLKQKDALEYFKNGRHKVIVATSVAEEGLDVTACNLVIRYEHVKNEIVRLQSRGRARAKDSFYYILTEEGSNLIQKEEELEIREQVMEKVLIELQDNIKENQQQWFMELNMLQQEKIAIERQREESILANITPGMKHIICYNCNAFLYVSTDIRRFQKSHRIVVSNDVRKRFIFIRDDKPNYEEDDFKSDGAVLCIKCQYRVGGVFEFMRTEFPLIKIKKRIKVKDAVSNKPKPFRKWKEVNFVVEPISTGELEHIVKVRDEYV